ncbi:MAG: hypothetical protein LBM77_08295 [Spirochaetaceae bacterium]|nr:hypothetical protein [Spirochaetaceae bacterium]
MSKFAFRAILVLYLLFLGTAESLLFAQEAAPAAATGANGPPVDWTQAVKLNQKQVGIFPVVDTSGRTESIPNSIQSILQQAVSNTNIGDFQAVSLSGIVDDPAVPPDPSLAPGVDYTLTSEILYDTERTESQLYLYLYDNTTDTLLLSDQMVYQTLDEANEFIPFTVDSLLDRIEKYNFTVTVTGNGIVTINGVAVQDLSGTGYARWTGGTGSTPLAITPYKRERLKTVTISHIDVNGNTVEVENTDTSETLNLNNNTYALGGMTSNDPFNTAHPLTITADFTDEYEPTPGDTYQRQFSMNLSYSLIYLIASGTGEFDNQLYPLGGSLGFDWMPFRGTWGNVGFGLNGTYNFLKHSAKDNFSSEAHMVRMQLQVFYETAHSSPFVPRFGLGFGAQWLSATNFKFNTGSVKQEIENQWKLNVQAIADLNLYLMEWFYIRLGIKAGINFPISGSSTLFSAFAGVDAGIGFYF